MRKYKLKRSLILVIFIGIFILSMNPVQSLGVVPEDIFILENTYLDPDSLDPAVCYESSGSHIIQVVYESLFTYDGSSTNQISNLANSYIVSEDGVTWRFYLRDDVTFQDGTPFNASAMKYSLDRAIIMNNGPSWIIAQAIKGAANYSWDTDDQNVLEAEAWLALEAIKVVDETTLEINLDISYVPFLAAMTCGIGSAVSPSYVYANRNTKVPNGGDYTFNTGSNDTDMVDMGHWFPTLAGSGSGIVPGERNEFMNTHMCGTGPYKLAEWTPNEQIHLTSADDWWKANKIVGEREYQETIIKDVYQKIVHEVSIRIADLEAGDCDAAYVPKTEMNEIYDLDKEIVLKDGLQVNTYPSLSVMYMGICLKDNMTYEESGELWLEEAGTSTYNATEFYKYGSLNPDKSKASPGNPFTSLKFRKAIAYAFDYDLYIDTALNGWGQRMEGVIPEGLFGHQTDLSLPETNVLLAKALFEEVGWEGNFVIAYTAGNIIHETCSLLLKELIEDLDVGITIDIIACEWSEYRYHVNNQHLGITFNNWFPDFADPDDYVNPFLNSQGMLAQLQQYANADIDLWMNDANTEKDETNREALYSVIEAAAAADIAQIYCYQSIEYLVDQKNIQGLNGLSMNPMTIGRQYNELWKGESVEPGIENYLDYIVDYNVQEQYIQLKSIEVGINSSYLWEESNVDSAKYELMFYSDTDGYTSVSKSGDLIWENNRWKTPKISTRDLENGNFIFVLKFVVEDKELQINSSSILLNENKVEEEIIYTYFFTNNLLFLSMSFVGVFIIKRFKN